MRVYSLSRGFFLLALLFWVNLCSADDKTFEVVGFGECVDCKDNSLKAARAFSGLRVTIDCKLKTGKIKTVGECALDNQGKFKISLPQEIVFQDGRKLKGECYAQLHSAAAIPCPVHSKIVFNSQIKAFGPTKNLQFKTALCTSKFFFPYFKFAPPFPKIPFPPLKNFGHPWPFPPCPPFYKPKPPPPPSVVEPPVKPLPPPVPKPKPPKKPSPPANKPPPPPAPVHTPKPKPPTVKPPPIYKPPMEPKPMPPPIPLFPLPPFYKKPLPPLPKFPPFPKNIPPNYFHHPMFGYFPPLPPLILHP